ncbi:MAG: T9SS type A sorting domain-containing protein [Flavobacteriales bacterium]
MYRSLSWTSLIWWTMPTSIRIEGLEEKNVFELYPNPTKDKFEIVLHAETNELITAYIYNLLGELIISESLLTENSNTLPFNLESYPKGIYYVSLKIGEKFYFEKIILQ